jgi:hypothetical protein
MTRRRLRFCNVRRPEPLETRTMLAGNGIMPFAFMTHRFEGPALHESATQFVSSGTAGDSAGQNLAFVSLGGHEAAQGTSLSATLTDSAGTATGTVNYSTHTSNGIAETTFRVSVAGATADTTFDVTVGDTVVGQLTTDDTGAGSLVLSSNPTGTEEALPANFPTDIGADTVVSVGTLSGMLAADSGSGDSGDTHGGGCHSSQQTSLEASLTDSNGTATGTATYLMDTATGDTTFSVSVTGAAASSTLDVAINDTVVGQLTTDETGAGSLVLSSNPTGTQQALPLDFPATVSVDSNVTVGTLSGTFTSSNSDTSDALYFEMHHFGRHG